MNARAQPVAVADVKANPFATHEVRNQARPSFGFNAFDDDRALSGVVAKFAPWARDKLSALGAHAGCESVQEAARLANEHEPKLLDPRPLRQPQRLGRVSSGLASIDGARVPGRGPQPGLVDPPAERPFRARRPELSLESDREWRRLPDRNGLRRDRRLYRQAAICDVARANAGPRTTIPGVFRSRPSARRSSAMR